MGGWKSSAACLLVILLVVFGSACGREQGAVPATLAAINPSHGAQGQTLAVILTGAHFDSGATVNVGSTSIGVSGVTVVSPSQIGATFAIASGAPLGATSVSVTSAGTVTNAVSFTIGPPLTVASTNPGNGATGVPINQASIAATFNQALDCSTVSTTSFTVATAAGARLTGTVACSGSGAIFTPGTGLVANTLYAATLGATVANPLGATLSGAYSWNFKTAAAAPVAPTVVATQPAPNATGVPLSQKLTATFNEAMTPATITAATFTVAGPGGAAVSGSVTYVAAGSVALFAPTAPLAALTTYIANISTGAESLSGTPLAANYAWSFTTGATPDTTKPTLLSTLPVNTATAVPINQAVSGTFSKPMDPNTMDAATFFLTAPGGVAVPALVTYAAVANTVTLTPSANLLPNTLYTATITNGAKDLSGNPLGSTGVADPWTFTTAAAPDTIPPTIVSTNPADAASNVAINATVNATFSEAMDPLTITNTTFQLADGGGLAVPGTVAYDAVNFIATFTPTAKLASNATYTATIGAGATDLAGNHLAAGLVNNPWNFTTAAAVLPAVDLGAAAPIGGFGGGAGMTNQGVLTVINGDIGTTGASTVMTGFHDPGPGCTYTETPLNVGAVNGLIYTAAPPPTVGCPSEGTAATMAIAAQAAAATLQAFNATSPALMPPTVAAQASELGGLTLPPGVYQSASGSFSITNGDLVLDAQGNANAVWVFQAATSLTVGIAGPTGARNITLINGAQAKNVFWHVGSAATINAAGGGTMVGTIIAQAGISFSTAGNVALTVLNGRALVLTGPVTMVNTVINTPLP